MSDNKQDTKQLYLFFIVSFVFTWLFWVPDALAKRGFLPSNILTNLGFIGAWGRQYWALLLSFLFEKKLGVKKLLKKGLEFKIGLKWKLIVFLFMPSLVFTAFLIGIILDGFIIPEIPLVSSVFDIWLVLPVFFSVLFLSGPLQEEFGWRGYALPRLQNKYNSLISTLILGFFWAVWHLPQFLVPIELTGMFYKTPILTFIPTVIAASFVFTWVYNNTNGSIFAQLILHTTYNMSMFFFPVLDTNFGYIIILIVFAIVAILIQIFLGTNKMEINSDISNN